MMLARKRFLFADRISKLGKMITTLDHLQMIIREVAVTGTQIQLVFLPGLADKRKRAVKYQEPCIKLWMDMEAGLDSQMVHM